ncbi:MAG: histidine phosphatase family protein [Candidatus Shapirobacteria bacterium]|nr:histidine phosphatase family protein [Candidatus Shapirobacteria bacterium]
MKIILFRHGEKQKIDSILVSDKQSVRLTDSGINQVEKLGYVLKDRFPPLINSQTIYSSFYARSIQSGEIVKSILNINKLEPVDEFGEFNAYSNYQNPKEFRDQLQSYAMQHPDWISPETNNSLNKTIFTFLEKIKQIAQKDKTKYILISTHGGMVRNTVYSLEPKFRPTDDLIGPAKIHEAGYTILNFDGQNFSLDQFDIHDFLD